MEKNIGRMVKIASNQLSREFDKFAKPYDLTGTQMSIIDFLSHDWKEEYFQQDIEKEFNIEFDDAMLGFESLVNFNNLIEYVKEKVSEVNVDE